jgi:hypothetical protein
LLVTLVGMSVVDCYRIYLNHDKNKYDKMDIVQFADELSLNLWLWQQKKATTLAADLNTLKGQEMRLERISNEFGDICQSPTNWQISEGQATGNGITAHCYICRKYMKKKGITNYVQTAFHCSDCPCVRLIEAMTNDRFPVILSISAAKIERLVVQI